MYKYLHTHTVAHICHTNMIYIRLFLRICWHFLVTEAIKCDCIKCFARFVRFILIKIYYILMNNLEPHLIYVTSNGIFIKPDDSYSRVCSDSKIYAPFRILLTSTLIINKGISTIPDICRQYL